MKIEIPTEIQDKILSINWFSKIGGAVNDNNIIIETDFDRVNKLISSLEWENITLEESNNMHAYLYKKNLLKEQEEWNLVASLARNFINERVIPLLPKINGVDESAIINDISWNLLHYIIEIHYSRKNIIKTNFFSNLLNIYLSGHLPCGWEGAYPNGKLVIA